MRYPRTLAILAALLSLTSCAKPPQAEIDAARAALDVASRNADLVIYAPDALRAAQETLAQLESEIAAQAKRSALSRAYEQTKSLALKAASDAREAAENAASAKQQIAREAAAIADELDAVIPTVESRIWAARRVPRIKLDAIAPLAELPSRARAAVAEARGDIAAGAFAVARAKLLAVKNQLSAGEETITEQTRIAKSR
jgi:hypothetical protein